MIERLLDVDNVDKYAEFLLEKNEVTINHFDRYKSKSFTTWLGIPEKEVIVYMNGKIKLHTEIDGLISCFEFNEEELVEKVLDNNSKYSLQNQFLVAPFSKFLILYITWGRKKFEDVDDFKQKLLLIFLQLNYYRNKYNYINQLLNGYFDKKIIDEEDKVKMYPNNETLLIKNHEQLKLLFVNKRISLDIKWGKNNR